MTKDERDEDRVHENLRGVRCKSTTDRKLSFAGISVDETQARYKVLHMTRYRGIPKRSNSARSGTMLVQTKKLFGISVLDKFPRAVFGINSKNVLCAWVLSTFFDFEPLPVSPSAITA